MAETKITRNETDQTTTRLSSKVISFQRALTAGAGDVAYTGVGFQPTAIICMASVDGTTYPYAQGFCDSAKAMVSEYRGGDGNMYSNDSFLLLTTGAGVYQIATVKSFDADGFTLTWTKSGSPAPTVNLRFICFR